MARQHTLSCDYPEGCSCGASEWNKLVRELNLYKSRIKLLEDNHHRLTEPNKSFIRELLVNGNVLKEDHE